MRTRQSGHIARMIFVKMGQNNLPDGLRPEGSQHIGLAVPLPGVNQSIVQIITPYRKRLDESNRRIAKLIPFNRAVMKR